MEGLELQILGPAFLAGLLVLATHVPLGQEVLKRGIIFIDLAIAQIAGLGIIAAHSFGFEVDGWLVQVIAGGSAMLGAILLNWTERQWQQGQEALIGVIFILAATTSILMLANNPHGGEHLQELLSGQILWVNLPHLLWVAALYAIILLVWLRLKSQLGHLGFYLLFALTVTASVQLVGVYLVFSSLIIPALATLRLGWSGKRRLLSGYAIGIIGYAAGLILSTMMDLPSGAMIVWCLAISALLTVLFRRNKS
ncbi:MAG: metal ABC transporter permease [Thiothrix sp.]|nr:MAG: metal ABC transporter permease [Thiothrix sp.]